MGVAAQFRRKLRQVAYQGPFHEWFGLGRTEFNQATWDRKLSGEWRPYIEDTISISIRETLIGMLIRRFRPGARVLELGCGRGGLSRTLGETATRYVGVDISQVAIDAARNLNPGVEFIISPLDAFDDDGRFDVIVLSEVLYFLPVDKALQQVARFAAKLDDGGIVIISMKDDPKAKRIFSDLCREMDWVVGILEQEKASGPGYQITVDAARPGFLIGVLAPSGAWAAG